MIFKICISSMAALLLTMASHSYHFHTLKADGSLSLPLTQMLSILDIAPEISPPIALAALQEKYGRKPGQERYQLPKNSPIEQKKEQLWSLFRKMGMIDEVAPFHINPDIIVIHGATIERMRDRVAFLLELIKNTKIKLTSKTQIFMITGDRELFPQEDITKSEIYNFCPGWKVPSVEHLPKTEGTAAFIILDQMVSDKSLRNRIRVLIAPKRFDETTKKWVRPHTGNTIESLLQHTGDIKNKRFLFISNNPYVEYQNAVVMREFLDRHLSNTIETVGPKTNPDTEIIQLIDNLCSLLQRELEVWERMQKF